MKKSILYLYSVLCILSVITVFTACEGKDEPTPEKPLALTLSADSVSCLPIYKDQPVLELSWTPGTNHGTGSAIIYTIDMDLQDNNFEGGIHWYIGRTANRTLTFSHKQLADTLRRYFPSVQEEQYATYELRVRATVVATDEEQVSPVVRLIAAWYASGQTELYLVGDAAPNGWDREHATPMVMDMTNPKIFTWTGLLRKGEFKLLTTTDDWLPCYVSDENDPTRMHYRKTEDDYPDFKWQVSTTGNYRIVADTKELTLSITSLGGEAYSHIYMIGDATPGGWSWDNITELEHPETNIFTWEGTLHRGEIKFPTEIRSDWSGEMLYAHTPDCAPSENGTFDAHRGDPDNKWTIPASGTWKIQIDIQNTTISFTQS